MPQKYVRDDGQTKKPIKSDVTSRNTYRYNDGADVQRGLQTQKQDDLMDGELFAPFTEGSLADVFFFSCSPHRTTQPAYHKIWRRAHSAR